MMRINLFKNKGTLMEMFEQGVKVAEIDITHLTSAQIKAIIAIQDGLGRTWSYTDIKPYTYPDLDRGKE